MTTQVTLSYEGVTANLTNCGISVSHVYNNAIIPIPTPLSASPVGATPAIGENMKVINIGFVTNRYMLRFTLTDGFGTINAGGNGATIYEKLLYFSNNSLAKSPKTLYINDYPIFVHIESFNITFAGGQKDLSLNCTLNLIAADNIKM